MHEPFTLETTPHRIINTVFFLHFNSNSAQSNVYHFLVILWLHINNYTFKKINWNILSLFKCQKSKNIRFDEYFCYYYYCCLYEVVNKGRGKFYLHYHIHIIPVIFVYTLFRTHQTMFVSELYCKLQYTYSLITLAFIFINFSCVLYRRQCAMSETIIYDVYSTLIMERCRFCWKLICFYRFFFYFVFSTLDGCCIGYFRSSENNKCESKLNNYIIYRKQL